MKDRTDSKSKYKIPEPERGKAGFGKEEIDNKVISVANKIGNMRSSNSSLISFKYTTNKIILDIKGLVQRIFGDSVHKIATSLVSTNSQNEADMQAAEATKSEYDAKYTDLSDRSGALKDGESGQSLVKGIRLTQYIPRYAYIRAFGGFWSSNNGDGEMDLTGRSGTLGGVNNIGAKTEVAYFRLYKDNNHTNPSSLQTTWGSNGFNALPFMADGWDSVERTVTGPTGEYTFTLSQTGSVINWTCATSVPTQLYDLLDE